MSYRDPPRVPVKDLATQQAIDEVRRALIELAREVRSRNMTVDLVNGVPLVLTHGMGKAMLNYSLSAPVGAVATGRITEKDRTADTVTLQADGFGATVTVSVHFT